MKATNLISYLEFCMLNSIQFCITGRPGIGKTQIVKQVAKKLNYKCIISHPVVSDPTDYKGLPWIVEGKAKFIPFSDLEQILENNSQSELSWPGVEDSYVPSEEDEKILFFFDDLGQAPISVQAAIMQLIENRKLNNHSVKKNVVFGAATNRKEDKAGVGAFIEPLKSRFSIVELEATVNDWVQWALAQPNIPVEFIGAVRFRPDWIEEWSPSQGIENTPNPRNIEEAAKFISLPAELRFEGFKSRLGRAAATELCAFLEIFTKLPSVSDIVSSPRSCPMVSEPSQKLALISALTRRADFENISAVALYIKRYGMEWLSLFMNDISVKNKKLTETPTYAEWAVNNY